MGPEDELVPCLRLRGAACLAYIRTIRVQQKIYLEYDAEIMVDNFHWRDMLEPRRKAVLDHELTHLEICKNKQGQPKLDDQGRAKIRLKPDDYTLTGFYQNVRRHGSNSPEWNSLASVYQIATTEFASSSTVAITLTTAIDTTSTGTSATYQVQEVAAIMPYVTTTVLSRVVNAIP
jgi:hypothetical protein